MAIRIREKPDNSLLAPDPNKTREQLIHEMSTGADGENDLSLSIGKISSMTNEDIISRIIQIDNQAAIIKWRMWWVIRQRFESDKLFGQWIEEFRLSSTQSLCLSSQSSIHRFCMAGKFCERYEINSLSTAEVSQTVIYELSRPVNEDIAGEVFNAIKFQRTPVHEVKRLLEQARSIDPDVIEVSEEGGSFFNDLESNVEVINYGEVEEIDSVIEVANEEDDDETLEEIVTSIKKYHLSSSSVRALIYKLNKMLE